MKIPGTNDFKKLANNVKTDENVVAISGIIPRNDELNGKGR